MKKQSKKSAKSQGEEKRKTSEYDYECEICRDTGWVRSADDLPVTHPEFGKVTRCICKAQEDAEHLQDVSKMTDVERTYSISDLVARGQGSKEMLEAGEIFLNEPTGILTIYGGTGNAKTLLLQAVVNHLLKDQHKRAVYVTMFDLMGYIRSAFDEDDASAIARLDKYRTTPVLAIDEFDKIKTTDWVLSQVTSLIDRRHRDGIAGKAGTLIAMNADIESMPDWIYSRLTDGRNKIIHNTDPDMRSKL